MLSWLVCSELEVEVVGFAGFCFWRVWKMVCGCVFCIKHGWKELMDG
jgi:hypothetical protein